MKAEEIVVAMVALHGNKLVGRTRMQKEVYLLERCGARLGLRYTYHYYGPYSFDLAGGWDIAEGEGRIELDERFSDQGVPYTIFRLKEEDVRVKSIGQLSVGVARSFVEKMTKVSDIVLEVAATILFLRDQWSYYGKGEVGPVEETKRRKPIKASRARLELAIALLRDLGLDKEGKLAVVK